MDALSEPAGPAPQGEPEGPEPLSPQGLCKVTFMSPASAPDGLSYPCSRNGSIDTARLGPSGKGPFSLEAAGPSRSVTFVSPATGYSSLPFIGGTPRSETWPRFGLAGPFHLAQPEGPFSKRAMVLYRDLYVTSWGA